MSEEDYNLPPVFVLDCGSYTIRLGIEEEPSVNFQSVVGRFEARTFIEAGKYFKPSFGDEAFTRDRTTIIRPFGIKKVDWYLVEELLCFIFREKFEIPPEEALALVTYPAWQDDEYIERLANLIIETFNVPALYMANEAVVALYSHGKRTGVVLDCGYLQTRVISVIDGSSVKESIQTIERSGEKLEFEQLFSSSDNCISVQQLILTSVTNCPQTCQKELLGAIVCCGGASMIEGFASRLESELNQIVPESLISEGTRATVLSPISQYAAYVGATRLAANCAAEGMWISREELEEDLKLVHKVFVPPCAPQKSARN